MCATYFVIMLYLSVKFHQIASVVYEQHNFRHNFILTSDLIATLTLGVGT